MENGNKEDLKALQLRFVGKIIAGFTHEIKNHLAIIKESSGLIGDMIKMGKLSEKDIPEYLEIIQSIEDQIGKAIGHFTHLNRFSHRMDTQISAFNLNECMEELIALLNRFARQKKIVIETEFQQDLPLVKNNPSMLQLLVFSLLENKISGLEKNSRIIVRTGALDNTVAVSIIPEGTFAEGDTDSRTIANIIEDFKKYLGGDISQGAAKETVITLPLH